MPEPTESTEPTAPSAEPETPATPPDGPTEPAGSASPHTGSDIDPELVARLTDAEQTLETHEAWNVNPQVFLWQPPQLVGLRIPEGIWRRADGHPAVVLGQLTADWSEVWPVLRASNQSLFNVPPSGVAVLTEAWALNLAAVMNDPEKIAEYQRVSEARKVHAHPDRIEVRTLLAVDTSHRYVSVSRMRGGERFVVHNEGDGWVMDAMKKFVDHIAQNSPPS